MKRNFLLVTVMVFVFGSMLSAAEPVVLKPFNGVNLDGWKFNGGWENCWKVGGLKADATTMELLPLKDGEKGIMINLVSANWNQRNPYNRETDAAKFHEWNQANPRQGVDIYTEEKYGDCTVKVELLITKGSNSGVYLMGEYEVQVADSFGKADDRLGQGDMGAIYSAAAPATNASGEPGTWQKYEIEFVAPKFDAHGNKIAFGLFKKVVLNGKVVQENVEVKGPTGGGVTMKEAPTGPLMFQGNHGPVAFRNLEIIVNQ